MKEIIFGDIHFGEKGNQTIFNEDCLDYLDFLTQYAKDNGISRCVFLGDWFHSRNSINVSTLQYAIRGIEKLQDTFSEVIFILGNHDTYYRDSLSVHSLEFIKKYTNVRLIDEITTIGNCTYVPWLVGDMFDNISGIQQDYVYGHFELPGFLLNAMVTMPDNGKIQKDKFQQKYVFSGHFHKRQIQVSKNGTEFHYVGNAFPHNFSDANDVLRGFCVHEHGSEPIYVNWDGIPKYCSISLQTLLDEPEVYINEKTYAKIKIDLNIQQEDSIFIRETFMKIFGAREIQYVKPNIYEQTFEDEDDIMFDSIDDIVIKQLGNVDSSTIDKSKLIEIYKSL